MLKADLHIHTREDPCDYVPYSARDMLKLKAKLGFNVLAITNHNSIYFNKELKDYAKKLGILLIPGMEALIQGKEVLVLNADQSKIVAYQPYNGIFKRKYRSLFADLGILDKLRKENMVIGAPHPFFMKPSCLGNLVKDNIQNFDFIEHSHFYTSWVDRNEQAIQIANRFNKPLIASTDAHKRFQLKLNNYTMIDSELKKDDVLEAIRKNKVRIVTEPITNYNFARILAGVLSSRLPNSIQNYIN
ncbi:MAG: PHP-associated domain-containing protein [Candidatus Woesearchaeota archaeon]